MTHLPDALNSEFKISSLLKRQRSMNIVLAKDKKHEFTGGQTICVESNHELNMFLTERCTHSALAKMIETCLFLS